jgi:hypothetical protein
MADLTQESPDATDRAMFVRSVAALLSTRARGFKNQHALFAMAAQLNRIAVEEVQAEQAARPVLRQIDRRQLAESIEARLPVVKIAHSR